jgi:hypothetical protein
MNGLDVPRLLDVVVEGVTKLVHAGLQCAVGHVDPAPYRVEQLVLREEAVGIRQEIGEQRERPRTEHDLRAAAPQAPR